MIAMPVKRARPILQTRLVMLLLGLLGLGG
jgi:hypothetical protein